jgi:hypothetical protein
MLERVLARVLLMVSIAVLLPHGDATAPEPLEAYSPLNM